MVIFVYFLNTNIHKTSVYKALKIMYFSIYFLYLLHLLSFVREVLFKCESVFNILSLRFYITLKLLN